MFDICKNVKIYQTINHYHYNSPPLIHSVDCHELKYEEHLRPSKIDTHQQARTKNFSSHSINHKRHGINVSIKEDSSACPSKKRISLTKSKRDCLIISKTNQSQFSSLKLRMTERYQCDSPQIIQSKITWAELSPRLKGYQQRTQTRPTMMQDSLGFLAEIPLKKEITKTTQQSVDQQSIRSSQPKIQIEFSPLKRSTCFIRNNSKSKIQETIKNSVDLSMKNSIDFKLSTSKIRRQDASQSLLRLSCSSYTQVFDRPYQNYICEDFSQTCSLELKKQESFLKQYANNVSQSIIMGQLNPQKQMKNVKSNFDLLSQSSEISHEHFKPTKSNIINRDNQSPLSRLKNKYGNNLLTINDKDTIISKSIASKSHNKSNMQIIDQSLIIQHEMQNKFKPIPGKITNKQNQTMFLGYQQAIGMLVAVKQIPINFIQRINEELHIYREICNNKIEADICISSLYQLYTHGNTYLLVKEPFQYSLGELIEKDARKGLINWEQVLGAIQSSLRKTTKCLSLKGIYLSKFITIEDLVCSFKEWKLHSPDMFTFIESQQTAIPISQAIIYLKEEVMNRIRDQQKSRK